MEFIHRPIGTDWRGERTAWGARRRSPFRATWTRTVAQLNRELAALGASDVIVQLDMTEGDFRMNGLPRANARPSTSAVILSFKSSRHGWLRYQCDAYEGGADGWQENLRAIVLGLEALRQVERYGITKRGEQYTGWKALPDSTMTSVEGRDFLKKASGLADAQAHTNPDLYRHAAKNLHPDVGGDRAMWDELQRAKIAVGL